MNDDTRPRRDLAPVLQRNDIREARVRWDALRREFVAEVIGDKDGYVAAVRARGAAATTFAAVDAALDALNENEVPK